MRKTIVMITLMLAGATHCFSQKLKSMEQIAEEVMKRASEQYIEMDEHLKWGECPRMFENGKLVPSGISWWCSGFYPGTLWYLYEYTRSEQLKLLAQKYTEQLVPLKDRKTDHDIGFQFFCSFGNGYRLTGNTDYLDMLRIGAQTLAARFNPMVGCTRSWSSNTDKWEYPVIIDNMMNLELLMWVGEHYKDASLKNVAITHANTILRNHFRSDYSTFHLVDYDPSSGNVRKRQTVQGYNDNSKWARGQSWALYGYTMMYRFTHSSRYLEQAESIASLLIPLLPADGIPYWDFDSPDIPNDYRDASAGSIMASALIELSQYSKEKKELYLSTAEKQLRTLASPEYFAKTGTNGNFLLKHSVGNKPGKSEVDVPLTYADYYFIEALIRWQNLKH